MTRVSVAMTAALDDQARRHLLRADLQEDVCMAAYAPSMGTQRTTALLTELLLPRADERRVHGNATFSGQYVVRAASEAAARGLGIALLHSHPMGIGWQAMSSVDCETEHTYTRVAETITGLPLVGMTIAGDGSWSARSWTVEHGHREAESIRVAGSALKVTWNDKLRPAPVATPAQVRTISGWGEVMQANIARLRVLVVGVGTVGLDLAIRLVQAGIEHVSVMDFDTVTVLNLDRLVTATRFDAAMRRSKLYVALRAMHAAATAVQPVLTGYDLSICEPTGQSVALDHDVIFSCVDRPWPRAILNQLAYSDLIPVIDGGIAIDPFPQGGMRNATCRTHALTPDRPCMQCTGQIDGAQVARDRAGLFDDETYIRAAKIEPPRRQNVSLLAPSVTTSMLAQFVSLTTAPGGRGVPNPLRFSLSTHTLEHMQVEPLASCSYEQALCWGDRRPHLTGRHHAAEAARSRRAAAERTLRIRTGQILQRILNQATDAIERRWVLPS